MRLTNFNNVAKRATSLRYNLQAILFSRWHNETSKTKWEEKRKIIGSAEALPILWVRYFRWERERDTERETDGSDVTIVALKLAMSSHFPCQNFAQLAISLHFPLPKIRTFRFFLHTSRLSLLEWSPLWRCNSQWVHTFRWQKISPSWLRISQMAQAARRVIENPRQMIKSCPVLIEKMNQINTTSRWK